jgi:protoporphyrinogen oxidase
VLGLQRKQITTLIEQFQYPRLGPGQMWETLARNVEARGVSVRLKQRCVAIRHAGGRVESIVLRSNDSEQELAVDSVLSTLALRDLVFALDPAPPEEVLAAARGLRYRDFCVVAHMTTQEGPFPDNWIYIHDPGTRAGRVQNFGAWSEALVPSGRNCLGVEYFCFEGDEIWKLSNAEAVELATDELTRIGLIDASKVVDGVKVLVPKAYPMYDSHYEEAVAVIRSYLEGFSNFQTCGRNGLHRYNNQDHSMWTAIMAVLNLADGADYDVWSVNRGLVPRGGRGDRGAPRVRPKGLRAWGNPWFPHGPPPHARGPRFRRWRSRRRLS